MAAVPSIGRADRTESAPAPDADLTRALYEQYAAQIFRYCLHQLGSREEAEDAVQSTFLNAFRGIKRGIVPEIESAWLFKIAHNVCLSRRRSTWRRGRIESPTDFEIVEEVAQAPSRRADELIGFQDVLERMPEQQRRAILLREWQGLSYREIGDELELSQAAVETLIFRARRALAQGLEQPAEPKRRRLAGGALANLLSSAQSFLLGGGAAVKVAATVAVVSAGTVVATAPVHTHAPAVKRVPVPVRHHTSTSRSPGATSSVTAVPPVTAGGAQRPEKQVGARRTVHAPAAAAAPLVATPDPAEAPPAATPPADTQLAETQPAETPPVETPPAAVEVPAPPQQAEGRHAQKQAQKHAEKQPRAAEEEPVVGEPTPAFSHGRKHGQSGELGQPGRPVPIVAAPQPPAASPPAAPESTGGGKAHGNEHVRRVALAPPASTALATTPPADDAASADVVAPAQSADHGKALGKGK